MDILLLVLAVAGLCVFAASKVAAAKFGGLVAFGIFGVLWMMNSLAVIIQPGHAGVVFSRANGVEKRVLGPGLNFIIPIVEVVYPHDCRTQNLSFSNEEAVSSDQQVVHTNITVNFHPKVNELGQLYQEVGFDYEEKIVTPVVREALKAEIAKQAVDRLLANREAVSQSIREYVGKKLEERHLQMDLISLTNIRFSPEYQQAVELKQVALQQAEAKRNDLIKAKVEADITRTGADAEAYKITAIEKALGNSPDFIRLEAVRKLNPNASVVYVPHGSSILMPGTLPGEPQSK